MKEATAIAIEKFANMTVKVLKALSGKTNSGMTFEDLEEVEEELLDALANENLTA